ncbi:MULTISPECIES: hypothetical protein [unclassified Borrelia]|uniref:hypothetical protein n=1 Tax=unclassified Borrelia TaxID=2649934 RepID=UPI001E57281A|nr:MULTISPECIES: hypothetical protein [unclassified Borrelia]UGQ16584.1 hypothetical protein LSO06_04525 [Borrelia sp. RT5S]UGQ17746.1 hypothetical protein LSO05_04780 [Borrelia sp. RT1S]
MIFRAFILVCLCLTKLLHSGEASVLLKEFSRLSFPELDSGIYVINVFYEVYSEGVLTEKSKGLSFINANNLNARLVYIEGKKSDFAYLALKDIGYYMLSSKSSNPIKVSPSYKVKGISSLQDVIGLDFQEDFSLLRSEENCLKFKSNKTSLYPFVDLVKLASDQFVTIHKDRNSNTLKEVFYQEGSINGVNTFGYIEVKEKNFENYQTKIYTSNFLKTNLNNSILSLKGFNRVFDFAKSYLK